MTIKYKRKKNIVFHEIDNEVKILDENQDAIISLNEAASLLWNSLTTFKSAEELSEVLIKEFEVEKKQALVDSESFLKLLIDHSLLSSKNK